MAIGVATAPKKVIPAKVKRTPGPAKKRRRKADTKKPAKPDASQETKIQWGQVFPASLLDLKRHPDNRKPTAQAIAERADSFQKLGQLEPILLREMPDDSYQIISGETRTLAAEELNWTHIDARSAKMSDRQALIMVGEGNANRTDLDPVERAKYLSRLCDPVEEGGAGMTQEKAGEVLKLTRSAVSNCVRLLKLPDKVLQAVSAGRIPETYLRSLVPLFETCAASLAEKHILKLLPKSGCASDTMSRERWTRQFNWKFTENLRTIRKGKADQWDLQNPASQVATTIFKLTEKIRSELQVFEFDEETYCLNVKRWEELNKAAARDKLAKSSVKSSARDDSADKAKKTKRNKELFNAKLSAWRSRWMRSMICEVIELKQLAADRFILWLLANSVDLGRISTREALRQSLKIKGGTGCEPLKIWKRLPELECEQVTAHTTAILTRVLSEESRNVEWPVIPHQVIDDLAKECGIILADRWCTLDFNPGGVRHQFYQLLSVDQLQDIAEKAGWDLSQAKTKKAKIELCLNIDDVMPHLIKRN